MLSSLGEKNTLGPIINIYEVTFVKRNFVGGYSVNFTFLLIASINMNEEGKYYFIYKWVLLYSMNWCFCPTKICGWRMLKAPPLNPRTYISRSSNIEHRGINITSFSNISYYMLEKADISIIGPTITL